MTSSRHLVVITGATRGLGKIAAERFWESGKNLVLIARHEDELKTVVSEFVSTGKRGQKIDYYAADLSDILKIADLTTAIKERSGDPDILINNAAIQGPIGPIQTNDWLEWQNCINVCLLAPVRLCQEFLPSMIKNKYGRIVNISGGGATSPRPNFSSYATAKCGLVRFSETLAQEVISCGITVNCIAPGAMNSELTKKILLAGTEYAGNKEIEVARDLLSNNPRAEIKAADIIYFLTSDKCTSITGKLISAVWDPWDKLPDSAPELMNCDVYTLRRVLPKDRNMSIE